ncbi:MAG: metal ABC transporter substrate-binding protein [Pseudomonadales bacterium]
MSWAAVHSLCLPFGLVLVLTLAACSDEQRSVSVAVDAMPNIYAVNYPTAYFAQVLAADDAVVSLPVPADIDPAYWQPSVETTLAYQQADLILLNGAGYARWVRRISLPQQRLVDTGAAFRDELIALDAGPAHSHGPEGAHEHGEFAFTTWLDLELAQQQVTAIAKALQRLMPASSQVIAERAAGLELELAELHESLDRATAMLRGVPVLFSHPVYQYLQQRYGLNGRSVHWEPEEMPNSAQWQALADILIEHPARFMIWEQEPLPQVRERLGAMGIEVIVYRTVGNRPAQGDFVSVMRANVDAVSRGLQDGT